MCLTMGSTVTAAVFFLSISIFKGITPSNANDIRNFTYVGCFDPSYALSRSAHHFIIGVTLEKCVLLCSELNTKYAGIEQSDDFCYCGDDLAEQSKKRNDSLCSVPCSVGNNLHTCGGDWLISLYEIKIDTQSLPAETSEPVGFLIGVSSGVRLYNSSDLSTFQTVVTTSDWAYTVDYHYAKRLVFVLSKRKLYKSPLDVKTGDSGEMTLVKEMSSCDGFAVDWLHDRIYWADCHFSVNNIMSMDLDGQNLTTVVKRPGEARGVKRMEVDPINGKLFWIAEGVVEGSSLLGGEFLTNLSAAGVVVRAMTLDPDAQRVYYTATLNQTSSLFSIKYGGGDLREHFSVQQMRSVYGLGMVKGYAYWVHYANSKDIIYKGPLNMTNPGSVKLLKTVDKAVWHMKVVHPDIQKRPVSDPCEAMPCSHICVVVSSGTACQCPDNMILGADKLTCRSNEQSSRNVTYIGCFDPSYAIEQMNHHRIEEITLEKCVKFCMVKKSKYAGIEISDNFCYCGEDLADESLERESALCSDPCSEGSERMCGGEFLMSLYQITNKTSFDNTVANISLGFLVGLSNDVRLYQVSESQNYSTLITTSNWAYTVDYHFQKQLVFTYALSRLFKVYRRNFQPSQETADMVSQMSVCPGFVVDWVKDRIFWANCQSGATSIDTMDFNGGNKMTIFTRPGEAMNIRRMEIDPYRGILFWMLEGKLESCSVTGENYRSNLTTGVVRALALDLAVQRVYYTATINQTFSLFSMTYQGEDIQNHFTVSQLDSVFGLGVYQGRAYWVNYDNYKDVIYNRLIYANNASVETITSVDKPVWHMRLLHPDLQSPSQQTMKLSGQEGKTPITLVLLALLAAAIIVVGGLLYAGRDLIRARLGAVIPYSSHRDHVPDSSYDTTGDNVNLIYPS